MTLPTRPIARQPEGTPAGGQFATSTRSEAAGVSLSAAPTSLPSVYDGMETPFGPARVLEPDAGEAVFFTTEGSNAVCIRLPEEQNELVRGPKHRMDGFYNLSDPETAAAVCMGEPSAIEGYELALADATLQVAGEMKDRTRATQLLTERRTMARERTEAIQRELEAARNYEKTWAASNAALTVAKRMPDATDVDYYTDMLGKVQSLRINRGQEVLTEVGLNSRGTYSRKGGEIRGLTAAVQAAQTLNDVYSSQMQDQGAEVVRNRGNGVTHVRFGIRDAITEAAARMTD